MPKRHLISDGDDDEVLIPAKRRNTGSRRCEPLSVELESSPERDLNDDGTEKAPDVPADGPLRRVLVHIEHGTNRGIRSIPQEVWETAREAQHS
ncbi:hypothetical protein KC318_g7595 [Hortaea werneckii]|nr:hypothetical protein KC334_g7769 [Hortaea werneckii]KAI7006664.1 hypothetical protein KC355_g7650 [Hortaea werneckii]KAI7150739.1 hypothetical protein KC324_g15455 [Hortaea werneckii]KAI7540243.1 hypothetical protein KC316_g15568 [Hortaea werneckii]KAI7664667.1 hypothetical protein KC318_g7595 [Hortaea werneckii]